MNTKRDTQEIQASFKRDPQAFRAVNRLKNPGFSDHLEGWQSKDVFLAYSGPNILVGLGASGAEESFIFQTVDNLPKGQYLAAFSYYYDSTYEGSTVDLVLGEQKIGAFTIERTIYPLPFVHFCFVVVDLEATPSATFMVRKPFVTVNDPAVQIDEVWLTPLESLPTRLFLVNGDFEYGSEYWTLTHAGVHPAIGGGKHLVLGASGDVESSAEQKLLWVKAAAGSYKLSFTIAPIFPGALDAEKGEVSLTGDGIAYRLGFEVEGDGKRTLDFIFDVSQADVGKDLTLRITKLKGGAGVQGWYVDDVLLEPTL